MGKAIMFDREKSKHIAYASWQNLGKRLKTAQLKNKMVDGRLASIQLSDAGNGEAQIALLHVILKHTWWIVNKH